MGILRIVVIDVNLLDLCICTRESNEESVIIPIRSFAGERVPAMPGFMIYSKIKRAVDALAQTLRHELTGTKIRDLIISPGIVATDLMTNYSHFAPKVLTAMPNLWSLLKR